MLPAAARVVVRGVDGRTTRCVVVDGAEIFDPLGVGGERMPVSAEVDECTRSARSLWSEDGEHPILHDAECLPIDADDSVLAEAHLHRQIDVLVPRVPVGEIDDNLARRGGSAQHKSGAGRGSRVPVSPDRRVCGHHGANHRGVPLKPRLRLRRDERSGEGGEQGDERANGCTHFERSP